MAVYKVPQDVEADDKLIGPFSFRQFIYLIIAVVSAFVAFLLSKLFIGLVLLPLPLVIFFGALALPIRKDQPMEIYLAAVIRFLLKPRMRLWAPEGTISLVTITTPVAQDVDLTKGISSREARQRLGYLAHVVDTGGWATRGVSPIVGAGSNLGDTYAAEAQTATDMMDTQAPVVQSFASLISKADSARHDQLVQQLAHPSPVQPQPPQQFVHPSMSPAVADQPIGTPVYSPYPANMHQKVIDPHSHSAPVMVPDPTTTVVPDSPSPDIMRLASNTDLSISAIAREVHRLEDKEVVISLR